MATHGKKNGVVKSAVSDTGVLNGLPSSASSLPPAASLRSTELSQRGRHFVDQQGRVVQLRGFNVSAASKLPTRPDALQRIDDETWFNHRDISFVGRPFALDQARYHFERIQSWGYSLVRLLVTWESLAHSGPFDIDEEYIEYIRQLLLIASDVGIKVVICAHQDVWSRLCGGSGAPGWTFESAGMDLKSFMNTKAAYVHNLDNNESVTAGDPREIGGPFVWPSGYQKLAAATLATLFWAGSTFAWKLRVDAPPVAISRSCGFAGSADGTVSIQEYLQTSYLHAFGKLADAVATAPCLLGFEVQNEPHRGLVSLHSWNGWNYDTDLHIGHYPTLLQSCALAIGKKQQVAYYVRSWPWPTKVSHTSAVDPKGHRIWKSRGGDPNDDCLWKDHGAWHWDAKTNRPVVLRDDFFTHDPRAEGDGGRPGRKVEWYSDFYAPFVSKFSERMRTRGKNAMQMWFEPIPNEFHPPWFEQEKLDKLSDEEVRGLRTASLNQKYAAQTVITTPRPRNVVFAPHFYDLNVLFNKAYNGILSVNVQGLSRGLFLPRGLYFFESGLRLNYSKQISNLVNYARTSLGEVPVVIGEIGIPFDINGGKAFVDGDWSRHEELLDALAHGMEESQVNGWCWWNYNPDNLPDVGDTWNKEDFSVVSRTAQSNQSQGRAIGPLIRPYAVRLMGVPVASTFDRHQGSFHLRYVNFATSPPREQDEKKRLCNVIFLPQSHFAGAAIEIEVSDGEVELDAASQTLLWYPTDAESPGRSHWLRVGRTGRARVAARLRASLRAMTLQDWLSVVAVLSVAVAIVLAVDNFMPRI
ncbi:unnamed protein product [Parajaminaea phylloscopi]